MRRWFFRGRTPSALLVFLLLLALLPSGCAQKKESGKIVLHFVTWKPNQPKVWEEVFRRFEAENPDIDLVREVGPHSSTAFHDLLTQKLKNKSPDVDVFFMDVIWPPEFAASGWAMPLDALFPPAERAKFLPSTILADTYRGKIYGVPQHIDSGILYYRKDLLKEYGFQPPRTWEEMIRQAKRITADHPGMYGFSGQFKQYEGLVCDMMEFILSHGGEIVDPKTGESRLADPPAVAAVRFVRDQIIGKAAPVGALTYEEPESLDLFIQGKAVFLRNWPYAWEVANNPARSRIVGEVGIAPLPHFPGGKSFSTLGGWQLGISSFSRHKKAAWRFVQFMTSAKTQKFIALKAGLAPTRKALYEDPEVIRAYPQFSKMKDVFLTSYPRPRSPLYPAISNILQRYFSTAISDPHSNIKTEAEKASQEIDRLLSLTRQPTPRP